LRHQGEGPALRNLEAGLFIARRATAVMFGESVALREKNMTRTEAEAVLRACKYWHYPFDLPWGRVNMTKSEHNINERHTLRRQHFFQPLLDIYEGSLARKTVLDLGCCQGYWSFEAIKAGAESCVGIDASMVFLTQAQALAILYGFDTRCEFRRAQIEEEPWWLDVPDADVTMALGVFYYLTDPILVLRKTLNRTRETFVIDTETVVAEGDGAILGVLPHVDNEPTVLDTQLSSKVRTLFSRRALIELLRAEGFCDITELAPAAGMPGEYHGYDHGIRRSLIARRTHNPRRSASPPVVCGAGTSSSESREGMA